MTEAEKRLAEGKDLVASGDIKLDEYRAMFFQTTERQSTLTDDEIIQMVVDSDDDKDPSDWVKNMLAIESAKADRAHTGADEGVPVHA